MKIRSIFMLFSLAALLVYMPADAQVKYDHDKFSNAKRKHKSMVEVNVENMLRYDVKNIQIIECVGEFSVSEAFLASSFDVDDFETYFKEAHGTKVGNETGKDYLETLANAVFHMNQKIIFENGLKNKEKATITSNPVYKQRELSRACEGKYDGSAITSEEGAIVASTSLMSKLPDDLGYDANEEFYQDLAKIANETGSEAEIKINFKVTINESGNPVLTEYTVLMDTWMSAFKKGKETVYKWKIIDSPLFKLKKEIAGNAEVMNDDGTINMKKFDKEMVNMLKDITEMFSYSMSDQFIKYQ